MTYNAPPGRANRPRGNGRASTAAAGALPISVPAGARWVGPPALTGKLWPDLCAAAVMVTKMLLDLSEIVIRDAMRVKHNVDQPGVEDPDLVFAEPLRGSLTFENSGDVINIQGRVASKLIIPCNRCLEEVQAPLALSVDEHFPIEEILHPDRQPTGGEEFDTTVSSVVYLDQGRPMLDLDELLRQLIVAELPIQTLCSETCAGLCPTCGGNRNETACQCAEAPLNTPLAGLAVLLKDGANEAD